MNRRETLIALLALGSAPLTVAAQDSDARRRIGFLHPGTAAPNFTELFTGRLRDLGWIEGRNLLIEYRWANGRPERLPVLARELAALKLAAITTGDTAAALAAKNATSEIPIVFANVSDPVGSGLVTNLARPEKNITGFSFAHGDAFSGKWIELLREAAPQTEAVTLLWHRSNPSNPRTLQELGAAAQKLNVKIRPVELHEPGGLEAQFAVLFRSREDGLVMLPSAFTVAHREKLIELATRHRVPAMYAFSLFADRGGLMSYGPDLREPQLRAADYVDKILRGAKPGDLPVEQPTRFEFVINRRTARALGLRLPQSVLFRADRVIE